MAARRCTSSLPAVGSCAAAATIFSSAASRLAQIAIDLMLCLVIPAFRVSRPAQRTAGRPKAAGIIMLVRRQARTAAAGAWGEARSANRTARRPKPAGILARLRRVRQRWVSPAAALAHDNEYAFLLERLIDAATLRRAYALAASSAVPVHEVLI